MFLSHSHLQPFGFAGLRHQENGQLQRDKETFEAKRAQLGGRADVFRLVKKTFFIFPLLVLKGIDFTTVFFVGSFSRGRKRKWRDLVGMWIAATSASASLAPRNELSWE